MGAILFSDLLHQLGVVLVVGVLMQRLGFPVVVAAEVLQ